MFCRVYNHVVMKISVPGPRTPHVPGLPVPQGGPGSCLPELQVCPSRSGKKRSKLL